MHTHSPVNMAEGPKSIQYTVLREFLVKLNYYNTVVRKRRFTIYMLSVFVATVGFKCTHNTKPP